MKHLILIALLFLCRNSIAQLIPNWYFESKSSGYPERFFSDLKIDSHDDIYLLGYENSLEGPGYILTKFSPKGDTLWTKSYSEDSGNITTKSKFLVLDDSNNVYVLWEVPFDSIAMTRYSPAGDLLGKFTYPLADRICSADRAADGILMYVIHYKNPQDVLGLVKIGWNGNVLWKKNIETASFSNEGGLVIVDRANNVYLSFCHWDDEVKHIIKFDPDGNMLYEYPIVDCGGYGILCEGYSIRTDLKRNLFAWNFHCTQVLVYDSAHHQILGMQLFSDTGHDLFDLLPDDKGNFYVLLDATDTPQVRKYDLSGNLLWTYTYQNPDASNLFLTHPKIGKDQHLYLAGSEKVGPNSSTYDQPFVLKLDTNGNFIEKGFVFFDSVSHAEPYDYIFDSSNNIYIGGGAAPPIAGIDKYFIQKFCNDNGCLNVSILTPAISHDILQVYPNPAFNFITVNTFNYPANSYLTISNVLGELVFSTALLSHTTSIDVSPFATGVYLITAGNLQKILVKE